MIFSVPDCCYAQSICSKLSLNPVIPPGVLSNSFDVASAGDVPSPPSVWKPKRNGVWEAAIEEIFIW